MFVFEVRRFDQIVSGLFGFGFKDMERFLEKGLANGFQLSGALAEGANALRSEINDNESRHH